jgi:hypothetical protein
MSIAEWANWCIGVILVSGGAGAAVKYYGGNVAKRDAGTTAGMGHEIEGVTSGGGESTAAGRLLQPYDDAAIEL